MFAQSLMHRKCPIKGCYKFILRHVGFEVPVEYLGQIFQQEFKDKDLVTQERQGEELKDLRVTGIQKEIETSYGLVHYKKMRKGPQIFYGKELFLDSRIYVIHFQPSCAASFQKDFYASASQTFISYHIGNQAIYMALGGNQLHCKQLVPPSYAVCRGHQYLGHTYKPV